MTQYHTLGLLFLAVLAVAAAQGSDEVVTASGQRCLSGYIACGDTCCYGATPCCTKPGGGGNFCCPYFNQCCGSTCCSVFGTCCAGTSSCCGYGQTCCGDKCCPAGQSCCAGNTCC